MGVTVEHATPTMRLGDADGFRPLLAHLPALPSAVRYYDDFLERTQTIRDYATWQCLRLDTDGRIVKLNFEDLDASLLPLFRYVVLDWFGRLDAKTVLARLAALQAHVSELSRVLVAAISVRPPEFRRLWVEWYASGPPTPLAASLRQALYSLCRLAVGSWSADYEDFVNALPHRRADPYKAALAGDCFIPIAQQAAMTAHFDEVAALIASGAHEVSTETLRTACALIVSYQFGVRPGQAVRLKLDDVRMHPTDAVHLRFLVTKQKNQRPTYRLRRVKREWCPILTEYGRRRQKEAHPPGVHPESFFCLQTREFRVRIEEASESLTGRRWSATDFRHTGAQRLADAGASHEEIQDYLMQSQARTANLYFAASATQAAKVNRAMGLSQVYGAVAEIARTRIIDKAKLIKLPEERQIGGMPHGIPIAGIGACGVGQPNCTKNPVMSCYGGCSKFLAVRDASIHEQVADDLRSVVREFYQVERETASSPAYAQLRHVIETADRLAKDIRDGNDESGSGGE